MFAGLKVRASLAWACGLAMGLLVGAGAVAGVLVTLGLVQRESPAWPELPLAATSTHGGETFGMCTGPVDDEVEGVFILDYLTGDLQCAVMSPKSGKFHGIFTTNVVNDLGVEKSKKPKYLMVTGNMNSVRGGAAAKPALSLVYVLDENTGHFCAYYFPWRKELANSGQAQTGKLSLLDQGKARQAKIN